MRRLRSLVLVAAAIAPAASGCSVCHSSRGCAYQRDDPSGAQAAGIHAASIRPRLAIIRRRSGPRIVGLLVNRWGELWVKPRHGAVYALAHDGSLVRQTDTVDESPPGLLHAFPVRAIDPAAIDRGLRGIRRRAGSHGFVKAELALDAFDGLRWEITVGGEAKFSATFTLSPDGRRLCERVRVVGGKASGTHPCRELRR